MAAAAAGKGGVRRLSGGRAGGRATPRPAQSFNRATQGLDYAAGGPVQADVIKTIKGYGEGLKKLVVRKEVSRPLPCEVNTAEVEQISEWGAEFEQNTKWGAPFKA